MCAAVFARLALTACISSSRQIAEIGSGFGTSGIRCIWVNQIDWNASACIAACLLNLWQFALSCVCESVDVQDVSAIQPAGKLGTLGWLRSYI